MHSELSFKEVKQEWHGSIRSYIIGFLGSLLFTLVSFGLVVLKLLEGRILIYSLIGLALVQAFIQLRYFLHVGQEDKPKWETLIFCFMVLILLIVALGTLWIMWDLDERVMGGMDMASIKDASHD